MEIVNTGSEIRRQPESEFTSFCEAKMEWSVFRLLFE